MLSIKVERRIEHGIEPRGVCCFLCNCSSSLGGRRRRRATTWTTSATAAATVAATGGRVTIKIEMISFPCKERSLCGSPRVVA